MIDTLIRDDGNGRENVTKKWISAASNFISVNATLLICQMLAIFLEVEF